MTDKILNVGLPRTGTQTLTTALRILGIRAEHYATSLEFIARHEACTEVPFPIATLVSRFPGSRFVLTIRDSASWLASIERTLPKATPTWNPFWSAPPSDWLALQLDRIIEAVRTVPPGDLLIMDICGGDGWDKLCPFLSLPVPGESFPRDDVVPTWPDYTPPSRREEG